MRRMLKLFLTFIGDALDNTICNMWIVSSWVLENEKALFAWSFCLDFNVKVANLRQVDITVDVGLLPAVFVQKLPLLTLIIIFPAIRNPI
ncbi:hypothetical protein TNIN_480481 [Trichonephila inaurata madagascariensis]|uniref:Uncharacterized protein n=1 Tax=Trichonephila inaurata madagascariensis TaxID=2747483 RepID=A0A8X6IV90_9ARAC|nr:hypothetical protein TNIN_480481 [Trichonephila inaurata madagascariensis]